MRISSIKLKFTFLEWEILPTTDHWVGLRQDRKDVTKSISVDHSSFKWLFIFIIVEKE